jgi:dienelactone hydrolase
MKYQESLLSAALALVLLSQVGAAQNTAPAYLPPEQVRADFLKLLDRPKVDPKPEFTSEEKDDLTVQTGGFFSEPDEKVPTIILKQTARRSRLPVVVYLHGTGKSKNSRPELLRDLARRGYLAVAIDARYHGDRVPGGAAGSKEYDEAAVAAWRTNPGVKQEYPFWYDTAFDLWRTVDYLVTRQDVDTDRIGMMGLSMGGVEIWLAASVDTRVKVSIPMIAVQSMRWSLELPHGRVWPIAGARWIEWTPPDNPDALPPRCKPTKRTGGRRSSTPPLAILRKLA